MGEIQSTFEVGYLSNRIKFFASDYLCDLNMIDYSKVWDVIVGVGSVSVIFSIIYSARHHSRTRAKFSFDFRSSGVRSIEKEGKKYAQLFWNGIVKNESLSENSITEFNYAVWASKNKFRTKANGMIITGMEVEGEDGGESPVTFGPNEAKKIQINHEVSLEGSPSKQEAFSGERVHPGLRLPKYETELLFKDVRGNLFDENGILRSQRLIDLWWTLPDSTRKLNSGNPFPALMHFSKIAFFTLLYFMKRFFRFIGL